MNEVTLEYCISYMEGQVAQSHADYLGNETGNSSLDHANRVSMRR